MASRCLNPETELGGLIHKETLLTTCTCLELPHPAQLALFFRLCRHVIFSALDAHLKLVLGTYTSGWAGINRTLNSSVVLRSLYKRKLMTSLLLVIIAYLHLIAIACPKRPGQ